MDLHIILVPYHLGKERIGMGRGPEHLMQAGLGERLRARGHHVQIETVHPAAPLPDDMLTATALVNRALAGAVRSAIHHGRFPIILAGNCNSALGTITGLGPHWASVVWVDAHGDFNTPETSPTGYFDGMPLAVAAGLCYPEVLEQVGGRPILGREILHVGGRDFDPGERELMEAAHVRILDADRLAVVGVDGALTAELDGLHAGSDSTYLHLDLDVLAVDEARANQYDSPGGLKIATVTEVIRKTAHHSSIKAASISSYDPAYDHDGRAAQAGVLYIETVIAELEPAAHPHAPQRVGTRPGVSPQQT